MFGMARSFARNEDAAAESKASKEAQRYRVLNLGIVDSGVFVESNVVLGNPNLPCGLQYWEVRLDLGFGENRAYAQGLAMLNPLDDDRTVPFSCWERNGQLVFSDHRVRCAVFGVFIRGKRNRDGVPIDQHSKERGLVVIAVFGGECEPQGFFASVLDVHRHDVEGNAVGKELGLQFLLPNPCGWQGGLIRFLPGKPQGWRDRVQQVLRLVPVLPDAHVGAGRRLRPKIAGV